MYDEFNIPPENQSLVYTGRRLEDGHQLRDYGIQQGAIIRLVLRLRGGMMDAEDQVPRGLVCYRVEALCLRLEAWRLWAWMPVGYGAGGLGDIRSEARRLEAGG